MGWVPGDWGPRCLPAKLLFAYGFLTRSWLALMYNIFWSVAIIRAVLMACSTEPHSPSRTPRSVRWEVRGFFHPRADKDRVWQGKTFKGLWFSEAEHLYLACTSEEWGKPAPSHQGIEFFWLWVPFSILFLRNFPLRFRCFPQSHCRFFLSLPQLFRAVYSLGERDQVYIGEGGEGKAFRKKLEWPREELLCWI